jgi:hypothetical protein
MQSALGEIGQVRVDMRDALIKEFQKYPADKVLPMLKQFQNALDSQQNQMMKFTETGQLLSALKDASKDGFNVAKFQDNIKNVYMSGQPGGMMERAGQVAGRGADISQGIDTARGFNLPLPLPGLMKKLGININIPLGNKYVGTVPNQNTATTAVSNAAMQSFFNEKK